MASVLNDDIRYLKLILLLVKGGTYVSRKHVLRIINSQNESIDTYLQNKKCDLVIAKKKKIITKKQMDILFPVSSAPTDLEYWDISLLSYILLNELKDDEKVAIVALREKRNELLHSAVTTLTEGQFLRDWTRLNMVLFQLRRQLVQADQEEYDATVENISSINDFNVAANELKSFEGSDELVHEVIAEKFKSFEQKLTDCCKRLDELEASNVEMKSQQVIMARIIVSALSPFVKDRAQATLLNTLEQIVSGEYNPTDGQGQANVDEILAACNNLASDMKEQGVVIVKVEEGSILVTLRCPTISALKNISNYLVNGMYKKRVIELEHALGKCLQTPVNLDISIVLETLYSALEQIEQDAYNKSVKLTLECRGSDGLRNAFDFFGNGSSTNALNSLSEALSRSVGEKVELYSTIDIERLKTDITELEQQLRLVDNNPIATKTPFDDVTPTVTHSEVPTLTDTHSKVSTLTETPPDVPTLNATPTYVPALNETLIDERTHTGTPPDVPTFTGTPSDVPTHPRTSPDVPTLTGTPSDVPTLIGTSPEVPTHPRTSPDVLTLTGTSTDVPTLTINPSSEQTPTKTTSDDLTLSRMGADKHNKPTAFACPIDECSEHDVLYALRIHGLSFTKENRYCLECVQLMGRKATLHEIKSCYSVDQWIFTWHNDVLPSKIDKEPLKFSELPCGCISIVQKTNTSHEWFIPVVLLAEAGCLLDMAFKVCSGELNNGLVILPYLLEVRYRLWRTFCPVSSISIAAKQMKEKLHKKRILIFHSGYEADITTQQTTYDDRDILYISIHSSVCRLSKRGTTDECGSGEAEGFNVNIIVDDAHSQRVAFRYIVMPIAHQFSPEIVFVSLGNRYVPSQHVGHMITELMSLADGKVVVGQEYIGREALEHVLKALLGKHSRPIVDEESPSISNLQSLEYTIRKQLKFWPCLQDNLSTIQKLSNEALGRQHVFEAKLLKSYGKLQTKAEVGKPMDVDKQSVFRENESSTSSGDDTDDISSTKLSPHYKQTLHKLSKPTPSSVDEEEKHQHMKV